MIADISRIRRIVAASAFAVIAVMASSAGAAAAEDAEGSLADAAAPDEMVRQTSDAVLDLIKQAKGYAEKNPERFYREVEALLSPVVDFESFARSVMAVHYRKASPEQRQRFAESFKWGLVRTYALALTEFDDGGKVVVVPPDRPPRNPKRQTVKMEIRTQQGEVYPVLYSVTQDDDDEWQIRNLIVNGVNMGLTYRNQFNSAMNDPRYDGDLDQVIAAWGELLETESTVLEEAGVEPEDEA